VTRPPGSPPPSPHLNPTRASTLVLAAALLTLVGWLFGQRVWGDIALDWYPLGTLGLLAVIETIVGRATKARIERKPGTEPVDPLFVARLAALAKASSLTGAVLGGFFVGLLAWLLVHRNQMAAAEHDLPLVAGGVVTAGALIAAALFLEYACRVPKGPSDTYDDADDVDDEAVPGG
jgi:hypothetical protein